MLRGMILEYLKKLHKINKEDKLQIIVNIQSIILNHLILNYNKNLMLLWKIIKELFIKHFIKVHNQKI